MRFLSAEGILLRKRRYYTFSQCTISDISEQVFPLQICQRPLSSAGNTYVFSWKFSLERTGSASISLYQWLIHKVLLPKCFCQCVSTKTSMKKHTHYRQEIEVAAMFVRREPIQIYQRFYCAKRVQQTHINLLFGYL